MGATLGGIRRKNHYLHLSVLIIVRIWSKFNLGNNSEFWNEETAVIIITDDFTLVKKAFQVNSVPCRS